MHLCAVFLCFCRNGNSALLAFLASFDYDRNEVKMDGDKECHLRAENEKRIVPG